MLPPAESVSISAVLLGGIKWGRGVHWSGKEAAKDVNVYSLHLQSEYRRRHGYSQLGPMSRATMASHYSLSPELAAISVAMKLI